MSLNKETKPKKKKKDEFCLKNWQKETLFTNGLFFIEFNSDGPFHILEVYQHNLFLLTAVRRTFSLFENQFFFILTLCGESV